MLFFYDSRIIIFFIRNCQLKNITYLIYIIENSRYSRKYILKSSIENSLKNSTNLLKNSITLTKNSRFIKTSPDCSGCVQNKKSTNISTEVKRL